MITLEIAAKLYILRDAMRKKYLKSRSFRHGFREGFIAPIELVSGSGLYHALHYDSDIRSAWVKVGSSLTRAMDVVKIDAESMSSGQKSIGKKSRIKQSKTHRLSA